MSERIELYTTPKGGEHTKPTEEAKKAAWAAAEAAGVSEGAKMSYGSKTGVYALTLPEGASKKAVTAVTKATAEFRTPEAKAELAEQLPAIKAEAAAAREAKAAEKDGAEKPAKEAKEPQAPRVGIDIYPVAPKGEVVAKEGETADKATSRTAAAEMAGDVRAKAAEAGIDNVAVAYHPKNQRWEIGVRGASEEQIGALTEAVSGYRTDEAKAAWQANAPERPVSKGKAEEPEVSEQAAMAKGGAER